MAKRPAAPELHIHSGDMIDIGGRICVAARHPGEIKQTSMSFLLIDVATGEIVHHPVEKFRVWFTGNPASHDAYLCKAFPGFRILGKAAVEQR